MILNSNELSMRVAHGHPCCWLLCVQCMCRVLCYTVHGLNTSQLVSSHHKTLFNRIHDLVTKPYTYSRCRCRCCTPRVTACYLPQEQILSSVHYLPTAHKVGTSFAVFSKTSLTVKDRLLSLASTELPFIAQIVDLDSYQFYSKCRHTSIELLRTNAWTKVSISKIPIAALHQVEHK